MYLFHIPVVIGLERWLLGSPIHPLLKGLVVLTVSLPVSFLLADGLRRLPGFDRVL